jgi:RND superfamily putative drug exporter
LRESAEVGWFWRWGMSMYRHRRLVAVIWIVLLAGLAPFAQKATGLLKDNGFTPYGSESDRGLTAMQKQLGYPPTTLTLVYESTTLDPSSSGQTQRILSSLEPLKSLPYLVDIRVNPAPRTADAGTVLAVNVSLNLSADAAMEHYTEIRSMVRAPDGMSMSVTGGTPILHDMQVASKKDIAKAEMIGLPISLVVLLLVFGTAAAAVLPLIVGMFSVTITLGITYFVAQNHSLSNFLPNMVTMLGLAVGIDYALFLVSRFREELKRQPGVGEAVAMTSQTAGKSIFFSGIAVLIGLLGMIFIDLSIFRSLCLGGVLVVSVSVAVANTLLPALLGLFGHRINSLRVIPSIGQRGESPMWERIAYTVMKRPALIAVCMGIVLIALMLPLGGMKLGVPNAEVLPPKYESRHGADLMKKAYDERETNPIQIIVTADRDVWDEAAIRDIGSYADRIAKTEGVKEVKSFLTGLGNLPPEQAAALLRQPDVRAKIEAQKLAKGSTALLMAVSDYPPDDARGDRLVERLRGLDGNSLKALVTGGPAYRLDILDRINGSMAAVAGFVMGVTYLVLLFAFRSVLLPLKAVLMNVLSLGASLGIVVAVFQHGYLADALHITSTGYVSATLPVIIFCVVFGISMDYEVFLISRVMEEYEQTGDNERSTAQGLMKTGSLITSAAFILVVVVGTFIFTDIEIIKALGLGLSTAVLIDATLVRIILVPALMKLLGKANWWAPAWIKPHKAKSPQS